MVNTIHSFILQGWSNISENIPHMIPRTRNATPCYGHTLWEGAEAPSLSLFLSLSPPPTWFVLWFVCEIDRKI